MGRSNSACHVAVLGGGLQGCCIALALAERGARVTLYDRNDALMTRAAAVNEGRMHLGYVYAADTTLATARMMIRGALAFVPFLERLVGMAPDQLALSPRTTYVVHRDSQRPADAVAGYFAAVHVLVDEAVAAAKTCISGSKLLSRRAAGPPPSATVCSTPRWSSPRSTRRRSPSIRSFSLAPCASASPQRRGSRRGCSAPCRRSGNTTPACVSSPRPPTAPSQTTPTIMSSMRRGMAGSPLTPHEGCVLRSPWIYRFKYGLRFRAPHARTLPTVTIGLGPYGDLVVYDNSTVYLSWYPSCLEGVSQAVSPPAWPRMPAEPRRARLVADSLQGMAEIVIPLRNLAPARLRDCSVQGGVIVAWGCTDIDDPTSELHHRYEIGVASNGNYHSVDPGKLTMAPYFAGVCVDRIVPR